MRVLERELRAALDLVLSVDRGFVQTTLLKFQELRFLPDDPAVRCSSLRALQRFGNGAVTVHFSPGGRVLKVVALFGDDFSSTATYRLPREYWPKESVSCE